MANPVDNVENQATEATQADQATQAAQAEPTVGSFHDMDIMEIRGYDRADKNHVTISTFLAIQRNISYFGSIHLPLDKVSLEQAINCLIRVQEEDVYPLMPNDLPSVTMEELDFNKVYIKPPNFMDYQSVAGSGVVAQRFLEEARICQLLQDNKHANLTEFYGCVVKNGRIVGLALTRYTYFFDERVQANSIDKAASFAALTSAVNHLHSLGLAHNDISPKNVMVNDKHEIALVELGACAPLGEIIYQLGTVDYNEGFEDVSSIQNDVIALEQIKKYLQL